MTGKRGEKRVRRDESGDEIEPPPAHEQDAGRADGGGRSSSKRRKSENHSPRTGLLDLPVELLYSIHIYAKSPSFVLLNRRMHDIFRSCPTSIKARYLLARWHEAYCYGFIGNAPHKQSRAVKVPHHPPLPTSDLLENGALAELTWSSRFLPVLPASEMPYPLSNSLHRSADHFVLDYCLRYRLTTLDVLHACEDMVLRMPEFGNIVVATGLWRDADGLLHSHEPRRPTVYHEADDEGLEANAIRPRHLRITELPKRLFQNIKPSSLQPTDVQESEGGSDTNVYLNTFDAHLRRFLFAFGNGIGPFPQRESLMLILAVAALHVPTTTALPAASAPFNSIEGLPLAKATFAKSPFMVQLLLALGAEPTRKGGLSLYIAIRSGWLEGLQQLVERDEIKLVEWQNGLEGIRAWFAQAESHGRVVRSALLAAKETETSAENADLQVDASGATPAAMSDSPHRLPRPVSIHSQSGAGAHHGASSPSSAATATSLNKRRRLLDRANLDSNMLKEAVKHDRWAVANWLRSKGIIPDMRTIKLIEMRQNATRRGGGTNGGAGPLPRTLSSARSQQHHSQGHNSK